MYFNVNVCVRKKEKLNYQHYGCTFQCVDEKFYLKYNKDPAVIISYLYFTVISFTLRLQQRHSTA